MSNEKNTKYQKLIERQAWSLSQKIDHTIGVLDQFINVSGGVDKVYVAFSGGKDSTVLLDIARRVFGSGVKGCFVNTGNEYPDIVRFAKSYENIDIIRPKYTVQEIIAKYGFPLVSKEISQKVNELKHGSDKLKSIRRYGSDKGHGKISDKWIYLSEKPYDISHKCCYYLKKEPSKRYSKETGRMPIVGTMASESRLRKMQYIKHGGCNVFGEHPKSAPLSIWTEEDVWAYINQRNLTIADIYYKGADRTGCAFCGFGCDFPEDRRFELLHSLHPKLYHHCMNYTNNGITYREALHDVLIHNNKNLPDE